MHFSRIRKHFAHQIRQIAIISKALRCSEDGTTSFVLIEKPSLINRLNEIARETKRPRFVLIEKVDLKSYTQT